MLLERPATAFMPTWVNSCPSNSQTSWPRSLVTTFGARSWRRRRQAALEHVRRLDQVVVDRDDRVPHVGRLGVGQQDRVVGDGHRSPSWMRTRPRVGRRPPIDPAPTGRRAGRAVRRRRRPARAAGRGPTSARAAGSVRSTTGGTAASRTSQPNSAAWAGSAAEQLRLPLHPEHPQVAEALDRLDQAVVGAGHDLQPGSGQLHRLVVVGVHGERGGADHGRQQRAGGDANPVGASRRRPRPGRGRPA